MHVACPCPGGWHTGLADSSIFKCSWKSLGSWQPSPPRDPIPTSQTPQKLFLCWQVRSIPGLLTCLTVFSRRAFLKQNAFVLPNIPYMCVSCLVIFNSVTPWTLGHQAPLSMELSRQEYWSGLQFLLQGIFPTQGQTQVSCIAGRLYHLSPVVRAALLWGWSWGGSWAKEILFLILVAQEAGQFRKN